jgi:hypothetical protein
MSIRRAYQTNFPTEAVFAAGNCQEMAVPTLFLPAAPRAEHQRQDARFGGSWGSTLALAYAIAHPATVQTLILRGVFLCRRADVDYFYGGGGCSALALSIPRSAGTVSASIEQNPTDRARFVACRCMTFPLFPVVNRGKPLWRSRGKGTPRPRPIRLCDTVVYSVRKWRNVTYEWVCVSSTNR